MSVRPVLLFLVSVIAVEKQISYTQKNFLHILREDMCNVADLSFMKTIFPFLVMSLRGNQIAILSQYDTKNY